MVFWGVDVEWVFENSSEVDLEPQPNSDSERVWPGSFKLELSSRRATLEDDLAV